jgi:ribonuclease HII
MISDQYEKPLFSKGINFVCGCDEVGIGSLCGDLYVCSLIFPPNFNYKLIPGLNDSKQKTKEERERLYPLIKKYALEYSIATASVEEINTLNVYWAKFLAFRRSIEKMKTKPEFILIDGNKLIPEIDIPQQYIIKGDGKSYSIAAASIIAKVDRDRYVTELSKNVHPDYGWDKNMGYYTQKHIDALKKYGKTIYHRNKYVEKFV